MSSAAESSMDDGGRRKTAAGDGRRRKNTGDGDDAAWTAFSDSFSEVQAVIDRNKVLIQQANENHQSRMPDNMMKNVAIINELNGNISKVASIYSDMSNNFAGDVRHRRLAKGRDGGERRNDS
ncbi:hypothetical protein vseg_005580 [Gypsophila vaccaria]